ncbi:spore protease YyaC [Niallia endozanthoxylica]|uniref:Spore protease YyaC n=2 Tax=Niallia endozanthoxylica TaxID=2036016 RepID=A0A5J5I437_9BACI|nr:spore protease YyaC [Niallia endozanthoxylica]
MEMFIHKVKEMIQPSLESDRELVFLCIGSDRYIGDSLGPLVGTMLIENHVPYRVYGTLEEPVHAFNLKSILKEIHKKIKNPFIISIDASIGVKKEVGYVMFKEGPLTPGKALEKMLPEVGDYHFVGFVNYVDPLPSSQFLNDTRLFTVMNLAKTIVHAVTKIAGPDNQSMGIER